MTVIKMGGQKEPSYEQLRYFYYFFILTNMLHLDIADGLVGVGLITQSEDNPGFLTLDKGYNDMSKFLNR